MIVYFFLWVLSVSALIAYICVIGFEMPLAHMEKMLFGNIPQVKRMFPQETKTMQTEKASEKNKVVSWFRFIVSYTLLCHFNSFIETDLMIFK